jgi:hypothetical protein
MTCLAYRDNGLLRRLDIYPFISPGLLQWQAGVARSDSTALWTHYKPAPGLPFPPGSQPRRNFTGYPWPLAGTTLDEQLVYDVARFAPAMLRFLSDRRDLGAILLHHDTSNAGYARRGEVMGRRWGELAAGVAQAIILARAIPEPRLEDQAFAILAAGHAPGRAVGRGASLYQTWSPIDINDLTQLGSYSSPAIRTEFAPYFPQGATPPR